MHHAVAVEFGVHGDEALHDQGDAGAAQRVGARGRREVVELLAGGERDDVEAAAAEHGLDHAGPADAVGGVRHVVEGEDLGEVGDGQSGVPQALLHQVLVGEAEGGLVSQSGQSQGGADVARGGLAELDGGHDVTERGAAGDGQGRGVHLSRVLDVTDLDGLDGVGEAVRMAGLGDHRDALHSGGVEQARRHGAAAGTQDQDVRRHGGTPSVRA